MEVAETSTGSAAVGCFSLAELRLEGSAPSAVAFSEPCPCCGNRKRRCLQPPTRPRKKLLVYDLASSPPSPPPLGAGPLLQRSDSLSHHSSPSAFALRRSGSSSSSLQFPAASLSLTLPPAVFAPFSHSHSFPVSAGNASHIEPTVRISPSPPSTPTGGSFVYRSLDPTALLSPPREMSNSSPSATSSSGPDVAEGGSEERKRLRANGDDSPCHEEDEVRLLVNCRGCGLVRELVLCHRT
ncbi:hypothetical protein OPV22_023116 [Ensete ventricosum]|uniref:Uncharacterized protein n=1 Tax=Ensete ventricosum TaxID=4639 RepID=A0AAV8QH64_ENSVE|nr:hypothetical protein OPV22_023116 [Ensete ventricosum]